jgi:hypothetical protein
MIYSILAMIFVDKDKTGAYHKFLNPQTRADALGKTGFTASQGSEQSYDQPAIKILSYLFS